MKNFWKWVLVLGTLLLSIMIGLVVMDVIGVWDVKGYALDRLEAVPAVAPYVATYRMGQENGTRLSGEQAALDARARALDARRAELEALDEELVRRSEELDALEQQLEQERQELSSARDAWAAQQLTVATRADRLAQLSGAVGEMTAPQMRQFLSELSDETISEVLALVDPEVGGMILGALDPARIAEVIDQHFLKPGE